MLKMMKSDRCRICRDERALRNCPRKGKDIGWRCCNEMRIDLKCPPCPYAGKKDEQNISPFPAFKSDSVSESLHAAKLHIDYWINHPLQELEGKTLKSMAAENPDKLLEWLSGFAYPQHFPMNYLLQKLNLPSKPEAEQENPETLAIRYLDHAMTLDWDALRELSVNQDDEPELRLRYRELISAIPALQKIKNHQLIHAGLADDGVSAVVFMEINRKQDWTLLFTKQQDRWLLRQQFAGSPTLFFEQNKLHNAIAQALGAAKDEEAWKLLEPNIPRYPDSADLRYYLAFYWQLVNQPERAQVESFNALALDNDFYEAAFSLGTVYLGANNLSEAIYWFRFLAAKHPQDTNVQNNLAAALASDGNLDEAKVIWQQILKQDPFSEVAKKNLERCK